MTEKFFASAEVNDGKIGLEWFTDQDSNRKLREAIGYASSLPEPNDLFQDLRDAMAGVMKGDENSAGEPRRRLLQVVDRILEEARRNPLKV